MKFIIIYSVLIISLFSVGAVHLYKAMDQVIFLGIIPLVTAALFLTFRDLINE